MAPEEYLDWRTKLGRAWLQDERFIALLEPEQQWRLHDYFQFHYAKPNKDALGWLFTIRECDPMVEAKGVSAFETLQLRLYDAAQLESQPALPLGYAPKDRLVIKVYAIVHPEPDLEAFYDLLIELGREQMRKKIQSEDSEN